LRAVAVAALPATAVAVLWATAVAVFWRAVGVAVGRGAGCVAAQTPPAGITAAAAVAMRVIERRVMSI